MKKIIVFLFALSILFLNQEKNVVIPKDSIRFRIIANSNSQNDQALKWNITKDLIPLLTDISKSATTTLEAQNNIEDNFSKIKEQIGKYTSNYEVNYGQNYFPSKTYKDVEYPAGNYNSLVITLGNAVGDNWWCVLFPPLCLLEADNTSFNDVVYKSYIKEVINRYF